MFGYYDDTIKDSVEHVLSESLNELTKTFTASARRWQMIMMPSLFAFIILATYGFFLIYSLTKDVGDIAAEMGSINHTMQDVVVSMQEMNGHARYMSTSMGKMSHDIAVINNSVSRPMQFMNSFTPW